MEKIPVTGFLVHSDESTSDHTHGLFITSWDGRPVHRHPFSGVTSFNDGHVHEYMGYTETAPTGIPHVHRYYTVTSVNDGHTHVIDGVTGPAINVPSGGHIHYFEGYTTVNDNHSHHYRGSTGNEVG